MKKRELKGIAKEIARNEKIIEDMSSTSDQRKEAMSAIVNITSQITSIEDLEEIDVIVLGLLEKRS